MYKKKLFAVMVFAAVALFLYIVCNIRDFSHSCRVLYKFFPLGWLNPYALSGAWQLY